MGVKAGGGGRIHQYAPTEARLWQAARTGALAGPARRLSGPQERWLTGEGGPLARAPASGESDPDVPRLRPSAGPPERWVTNRQTTWLAVRRRVLLRRIIVA